MVIVLMEVFAEARTARERKCTHHMIQSSDATPLDYGQAKRIIQPKENKQKLLEFALRKPTKSSIRFKIPKNGYKKVHLDFVMSKPTSVKYPTPAQP